MEDIRNYIELCGEITGEPEFSHTGRNEDYYVFPMSVSRLSGNVDTVNVLVRDRIFKEINIERGSRMGVIGEVRSFNNKSGTGNRLIITVFAKTVFPSSGEDKNAVEITGVVCKKPNLRWTPMGREICDIMLAVNRRYGRSDYLPCIAWGQEAANMSYLDVGAEIKISGRLQSRKVENDVSVEKTAFEISINESSPVIEDYGQEM